MRFDPRTRALGSITGASVKNWLQRGGGSSIIKSMQVGTVTINATTTGTATISAVVLANSILVYGGCDSDDGTASLAFQSGQALLTFTNTTTITAARNGSAGIIRANFTVIEFQAGVLASVQRGSILIAGGASTNTATITAVATAKSAVLFLGINTGGQTANAAPDRLTLTNSTTVTADRGSAAGAASTVGYQVVEFL